MFRIFHRALILFVSILGCINLIAVRPLPPPPDSPAAPPGQVFFLDRRPSRGPPLSRATPDDTPAAIHPHESLLPRDDRPAEDAQQPQSQSAPAAPSVGIRAPQAAPAAVMRAPARIAGDGPWMRGERVAQTERLDIYVGKQTFSAARVAALAPLLEQLLREDEARFGTTLKHRVSVGFYRVPPKRDVRGMAYTDSARAKLFYRPYEDAGRAATIAAHELGHHLEAQRYGEDVQRRADTILHEGMATWIAGERWLAMCGATSWRERARQLHDAGIPQRLLTAERSGADNAYELWASFVDFLAERYGWDTLDALYRSGRGRAPGSSNYKRVLGKSFDDLSDEWRAWVNE